MGAEFDKANTEYLKTPMAFRTALNAAMEAETFSVSFWYKRASTGTAQVVFGNNDAAGNGLWMFFVVPDTFRVKPNSAHTITTVNSWPASVWGHVVFTIAPTPGKMYIYVNGSKDPPAGVASPVAGLSSAAFDFCIGAYNNDGTPASFFDGLIADLAVWNVTLTPTQVSYLYSNRLTALHLPKNLIGYWRLHSPVSGTAQNGDAGLVDRSTSYNHATIGTAPDWSSDDPGLDPPRTPVFSFHGRQLFEQPALFPVHSDYSGIPPQLLAKIRTLVTVKPISPRRSEISWTSTETPGPFYVRVAGQFVGKVYGNRLIVERRLDENASVEVLTSADAPGAPQFPDTVELSWVRVDNVDHYRIEQYIDSTWTGVGRVNDDGLQYFFWESDALADCTTHQFRIVFVGTNGIETTGDTISRLIVRRPDIQHDSDNISFDNETGKVTVSA